MGDSFSDLPRLEKTENGWQLIIDGAPFLCLAAELQNSSMSASEYMKPIWPQLAEANINTCLGPVAWEQLEVEEGHFVFDEIDNIIVDARKHNIRLVLLWFGAFKNGRKPHISTSRILTCFTALSTYVPGWVKQNPTRFPRAVLRKASGKLQVADSLSLFGDETRNADAKAFGTLMKHLRNFDHRHHTIIMVQVENEVGILGDSRDASPQANRRFTESVPLVFATMIKEHWETLHPMLQRNLGKHSSLDGGHDCWEAIFGRSAQTDELFMAYHFAVYLEQVTAAGKQEYPLPMYTNVWQNYADGEGDEDMSIMVGGGGQPGDYPSGGGVINVLDIWKLFAPSLDFIAPDIYLNDYDRTCGNYRHRNQPLFIPEQRRDEYGARRIWTAFGSHQALGTAPFGIDTVQPYQNPFKKHYGLLSSIAQHVLEAQRSPNTMAGFFFDEIPRHGVDRNSAINVVFEPWHLTIERSHVFGKPGPGFGLVIRKSHGKFLLVGEGFQIRFASTNPRSVFTGILRFVEKIVLDPSTGSLKDGRLFNGDETRSGQVAVMPGEDPDYGDFPISITIPAKTRIAECTVYCLQDTASEDATTQQSHS